MAVRQFTVHNRKAKKNQFDEVAFVVSNELEITDLGPHNERETGRGVLEFIKLYHVGDLMVSNIIDALHKSVRRSEFADMMARHHYDNMLL